MCNCPEPAFASQEFSVIHSSDGATAFRVGRVRWPRTGLSCTEPQGVSANRASIPRAIMSRSPEALAFGSRRHFIPASLSLPLCGCLVNRSRDCSRSRVPPRFPRRRYADAPAAAFISCLRFASAGFRQSRAGERNWKLDSTWGYCQRSGFGPMRLLRHLQRTTDP
jgi:hypothetical protein